MNENDIKCIGLNNKKGTTNQELNLSIIAQRRLPDRILTWLDAEVLNGEERLENVYTFSLSCVAGDLPILEIYIGGNNGMTRRRFSLDSFNIKASKEIY